MSRTQNQILRKQRLAEHRARKAQLAGLGRPSTPTDADRCPKCGGEIAKKTPRRYPDRPAGKYYYAFYYGCLGDCGTTWMPEEGKCYAMVPEGANTKLSRKMLKKARKNKAKAAASVRRLAKQQAREKTIQDAWDAVPVRRGAKV